MIWIVLATHAVAILAAATLAGRLGRAVFAVAAVPPALATTVAVPPLTGDTQLESSVTWVDGLDLTFAFRLDTFAALLTLLVSGIGALIMVYAGGYFSPATAGLGRFSATLLSFSVAMLGLVWADSVWTLFVFWEATSITSFLLVGHKNTDAEARQAARRALIVTAAGGLVLLAGSLILVDSAGGRSLTDLPPVAGTTGTVAAILVLVAAATKSAQVPFHVWLPGAMAAPTPVSAYLHSATMVKAGVVLVALVTAAMRDVAVWKPLGLTFGLGSMVWGAIGALRHSDGKLILAWGTVSQLGLMIGVFSLGTGKATFAGVALVLAHAVFKAALFMVVGEIDVRTGTRDIAQLSGLWRSMPVACAVAIVSGASMAGLPPLLGFTAKEAAIEAALTLDGSDRLPVLLMIAGGSVLTVAYTVRFLIGTFGAGGSTPTPVGPRRVAMTGPAVVLGVLSVALYGALGQVNDLVRPAAVELNAEADVYSLYRWPGLTDAFLISAAIVVAGLPLGWWLSRRSVATPNATGAAITDSIIDRTLVAARVVTGRVQHGSLPVYAGTVALTAALVTLPFLGALDTAALYRWDSPVQALLGLIVLGAAAGSVLVSSRLGAALGLGAVGLAVTGLFVVHGAPDLALTQLLVETVVVVGFVVGLGHLRRRFPDVGSTWRVIRIVFSGALAIGVGLGLAATASDRTGDPPVEALMTTSVDPGGGNNAVNVILTDTRGLDTLGEIVVLVVVATGIIALAAHREESAP